MKIKRFVIILFVVVAAGIIIIGFQRQKVNEKPAIKIGALLPLTGPLAFFGEPERAVLLMAVDEINEAGGIDGSLVQLIIEDSKGTAKDGVNALNKLLLINPETVITSLTVVSNATQPILDSRKIPQVALSVHPTIAKQSNITIRPYYGFEEEMQVLAKYIMNHGYKTLGILWVAVPECEEALDKVLFPILQKENISVVASENYSLGTSDLRDQLIKIKAKNPDGILVLDFGSLLGIILKQAEELKIRERLIGNIGFFYAPPIDKSLLEGIVFSGPSFVIMNSENYLNFSEKIKTILKISPSYDVAYTYDAFNLLMSGIQKAKINKTDIITAIKAMKQFSGITGTMNIMEDGNVKVEIIMGKFKDGKMIPIEY